MNTLRLVLQRLGGSLLVLLGAAALVFVLARVIPGDPARIALGPRASVEAVQQLRQTMGLDLPLPLQFASFLSRLAHGDLGLSLYTRRPVVTDLATYAPATLELVLFAGLLIAVVGVSLGVVAARRRGTLVDAVVRLMSLAGIAAPSFVWGVILMLVFSYALGILPATGRLSPGVAPPLFLTGLYVVDAALSGDWRTCLDAMKHLILPATALAMAGIGQAARLTRANMVDVYARPYIEFFRAFGVAEGLIARRYALWPAMIPTLTVLGLDIAALLGNAFLVEAVFNWPGLARYGVSAILNKDLNAIVGIVVVVSFVFVMANAVVDICVSRVDPRIRLNARSA